MSCDDDDEEEEDVDEVEGDDDTPNTSQGKRNKVDLVDERCTLHSTDPDTIAGFKDHPVSLTIGVDPGSREPATAVWCLTERSSRDTMWEVIRKCDPQLGGVYKVVRGAMSDTKG